MAQPHRSGGAHGTARRRPSVRAGRSQSADERSCSPHRSRGAPRGQWRGGPFRGGRIARAGAGRRRRDPALQAAQRAAGGPRLLCRVCRGRRRCEAGAAHGACGDDLLWRPVARRAREWVGARPGRAGVRRAIRHVGSYALDVEGDLPRPPRPDGRGRAAGGALLRRECAERVRGRGELTPGSHRRNRASRLGLVPVRHPKGALDEGADDLRPRDGARAAAALL
mmetsp:Transcript_15633/g.35892  ORF Transcript_15633/g.35892 Transcript_15633/m.35892 type:complete len:224 (+) Transcript_15633:291-962(+)